MSNEEVIVIKTVIQRIQELCAVETLEYHNKNWLALNDARRSEQKLEELLNIHNKLKELIK